MAKRRVRHNPHIADNIKICRVQKLLVSLKGSDKKWSPLLPGDGKEGLGQLKERINRNMLVVIFQGAKYAIPIDDVTNDESIN